MEHMNYWDADMPSGLKSAARVRAKQKSTVHFWTNCAVSLVKQLWNGNLNDDLLLAATGGMKWDLRHGGGDGVHITNGLREKINGVLKRRPEGFPKGAAAIRRQQGVEDVRHPDKSGMVERTQKQKK